MISELHFAHANGLPSATYQLLLSQLEAHYQIKTIPMLGHDPAYPVTNNWTHLKRQLIHTIEREHQQTVIGVGHSLGGALTLMAALDRPELFKAVVLLDVPTFNMAESWLVRMAKSTGLIDHITPARKSKNRRTQWPSREVAIEYFAQRKMFANFHPQCLADYVTHSLVANEQGSFDLGYRLEVELAVYRTLPHKMVLSKRQMKVPMGVLVGRDTDTVRQHQYRRMKHKLGFTSRVVAGSHMFPLEYPVETARDIRQLLIKMGVRD